MKKVFVFIAATAFALCVLAGCSSGSGQGGTAAPAKKNEVKIDQIDWSVENTVMDKRRRVAFSYTNNSEFPIVEVELMCSPKADTTPETLREACASLTENGWSTEDLDELGNMSQEEIARLYLTGDWCQIVEPGESSGKDAVTIGYAYINSLEQYDLFEPSMMTISFLVGDELYTETYDFKTGSYSFDGDPIDTKQWSESELASQLPQPDSLLVAEMSDSEKRFTFETIGTTQSDFKAYVKACKEKGFTKNVTEGDSYFYVKSADGKYDLDIFFSEEAGSITCYLDLA